MNVKVGRNDPCPCGSGKKYKHCCGGVAAPAPAPVAAESNDGAVGRALAWLAQHHRKAFAAALEAEIDSAICASFDDDEEARDAMAAADDALWQQVQINFSEWMLAEGDITVKGEPCRVAELLLGPRGPLLSTGQRAWLAQLAQRPLRLYDVTEVVPGTGLTLCDAVYTTQAPITVAEREGSRTLRVGMQIGARLMAVADGHQLSGAVYPFAAWAGRALQQHLLALETADDDEAIDDLVLGFGLEIMDAWLAQYLHPAPLPQIMHSHTGEPMVFVADHYEVKDFDALTSRLAAQADVSGDQNAGWSRSLLCDDGQTRPLVSIEPQPAAQRVVLRYQTAGLTERGRAWFDPLAGDTVKFLIQDITDPKGLMSTSAAGPAASPASAAAGPLPAGIDAQTLADVIEAAIKRSYARWADEPIPALANQTPRDAMTSAAGLERVKGLLRSYQDGEAQQAAQQGRRTISYQFLWDALGLKA